MPGPGQSLRQAGAPNRRAAVGGRQCHRHLAHEAQQTLQKATHISAATRERLTSDLSPANETHHQIRHQSRRLTQGKRLRHHKIVNAYDPTIAPIIKGKSNCPAQFGRKPGIVSEPTGGFIFAARSPLGNPSDPSYVLPLLDNVEKAIERLTGQTASHPFTGR